MARRRNSLASLLSGSGFSNYGEVPTIAVGDSAFTPSVFNYTPLELKPQDYSILQRSMALQEQRETEANKAFYNLNESLGKAKMQLYNSQDNADFVDRKQSELFNNVNQALALGDYNSAIQEATTAGARFANDNELLARIKTSEEYNNRVKTLEQQYLRGDIEKDTYLWWLDKNKYEHQNIEDNNGNVIGGKLKDYNLPVKDVRLEEIYQLAAKMVEEAAGGSKHSTTNENGTGTATEFRYNEKQKKDILRNAMEIFNNNSQYRAAVQQRYLVDIYRTDRMFNEMYDYADKLRAQGYTEEEIKQDPQYARLNEIYENESKYITHNDQTIEGYEEYFRNWMYNEVYADNLSYRRAYNSTDNDNYDRLRAASAASGQGGNYPNNGGRVPGGDTTPGPHAMWTEGGQRLVQQGISLGL